MTILFADTSAIVRAYFVDEPDHVVYRALVLEGDEPVVASELARVEVASAAYGALRGRRIASAEGLVNRFDADCQDGGLVSLIPFDATALPVAFRLVGVHRLRTLDALHLAVFASLLDQLDDDLQLLTADDDQRVAANREGYTTRSA